MNIVVDLDDVIANFAPFFIDFLNEQYGTSIEYEKIRSWGVEKYGDVTKEDVEEGSRKFALEGRYGSLPLIEGAKEGLEELSRENNIFIVTYRLDESEGTTLSWLEGNSIPYDDIYFSNNKPKHNISKALDAELAIDDNISHLRKINFNCQKYLFNRHWNEDHEVNGLKRVYNWDDILDKYYKNKK